MEVFSGQGEVTRALRSVSRPVFPSLGPASKDRLSSQANMRGAAIDLSDDPRCFDVSSPAGFVLLGFWELVISQIFFISGLWGCDSYKPLYHDRILKCISTPNQAGPE